MTRSILFLLAALSLAGCESGGLYGNASDSSYGSSNY